MFALARRECGNPRVTWMVGDNPIADVRGAEAVGIPAVLVRTESADAARRAADLEGVEALIERGD